MTANMAVMNMAPNVNPRLHRTQRGLKEIRKKSHVLTQCERLILALVDGDSSIEVLKRKLGGVVERRFRLAAADLKAKGFIEERMAAENAQAESIDSATLEKFVRQDPLDPVTITALKLQPQMLNVPPPPMSSDLGDLESATLFVPTDTEIDTSRGVDIYLPLEPQPVQLVQPVQPKAPKKPMASELIMGNTNGVTAPRVGANASTSRRARRARRSRYIQVGYWLLFAGLVCVALMIAALRNS